MILTDSDWQAIELTVKLATTVTVLLILLATPLAWWMARSKSWLKNVIAAVVTLPLILPPTVLGFYLLLAFSPTGFVGEFANAFGVVNLVFSFWGLVMGSMIYSLPFVVQPLYMAFQNIDERPLEVAATLRAGPIDRFFSVVLPLSKAGFITAAVLGFAHTVGEFGVVLMIGGNIPGETRVMSVQIYDYVEALEYGRAHIQAGILLGFSFVILLLLQLLQPKSAQRGGRNNGV